MPALWPRSLNRLRGAVELETDVGPMWYPEHCRVLTPAVRETGVWEPQDGAEIVAALQPGMTVVDVGAHVGYFALLASRAVGPQGRVIALEPSPQNHRLLRANVARSRARRNVRVVNAAAWREDGTLSLRLSPTNTGDNRVYEHDEDGQEVQVTAVALDGLLARERRVDYVILDTQGAERPVLEGMRRTLRRDRPRIMAEFWPHGIRGMGDDPLDTLRFYREELGYGRIDVLGSGEAPDDEGILEYAQSTPGGFCTLLLEP
jgi:FkbM family methyltransferase